VVTVAMTNPVPPERFASWRAAVAEMAGPRRAEFAAARRRQGIDRQIVWVQQTPEGPREILLIETADPARAFMLMATSQDPFDVWFRQVLVDTFGIDLTQSAGPPPEQLLDWSAEEPA
jgi:hypothetical protein